MYTGRTADGSDAKEVQGMYVSPDGSMWSNQDRWSTKEEKRERRLYNRTLEIMDNEMLSLSDLKKQIDNKTHHYPCAIRNYILSHYNEDGSFKF